MKTRLITLLIAITAIIGSVYAQEYDRVIELYKGGELIHKYKVSELDSIKFNKEYKCSVSATVTPSKGGTVTINGATGTQYVSGGGTATFVATPNSGYNFKNWTLNGEEVSIENPYTATITSDSEFIANFEPQPTHNGYAYIDLGLPSGIKWATCNVGATTPEEYGDYFAWGETETKTTYNWSTYKYCNGTDDSMTKYCMDSSFGTVDNKTVLELSDDAARVNWGGTWRMPTKAEQDELRDTNNCTWEWTTQNGVNGYKVTSKKNGNSIFLPAAGFRDDSTLHYAGTYGYYWSSSLGMSISNGACNVDFGPGYVSWYYYYRNLGQSVRAVFAETYTVSVSTPDEAMGTAEASKSDVESGESVTLTATPNSGYIFKNWTLNGNVVSTQNPYTATITSNTEFVANFKKTKGEENGYTWIDLDLPSGIKWATCNVGATMPEEYGDYFAWGETETKTTYEWSTYKYCNGTRYTMTKYCTESKYGTVDNKTTLELSDDAARVNWGGNWRMPTQSEQDELRDTNNCTWEWTTQNGVNGYKVTSKKNGNSIFLPAAGCRDGSSLGYAGSYGIYWSSSLYTSYSYDACDVFFYSDLVYRSDGYRSYGQSVRAVFAETYTVSVSTPDEAMGTAEVSKSNVESGESVTLTATPNEDYRFVNWTVDGVEVSKDNPYTTTITASTQFKANFVSFKPTGMENGKGYVDLGLSVKWATCNVGATTLEEYGDYFAWGETEPKGYYDWSTYEYCYGDMYSLTKYCIDSEYGTVDNKTTLELSDDAARVNWGGSWRMPTKAEQDELLNTDNCTWTWTTQNGVNGYKVTSKKNGNSIFLPAAGCRYGSSLYDAGSYGCYWSSSLDSSYGCYACNVYFNSVSVDGRRYDNRSYGQSVRAVCE